MHVWSGVELDEADFAAHLGVHWPPEQSPADYLASIHGDDLFLAAACALRKRNAVEIFEQKFMSLVPGALAHLRLDPAVVEDLQQELRTRLLVAEPNELPRIANYAGRGSLKSWLQASAVKLALNWLYRAENRKRIDSEEGVRILDRMSQQGISSEFRSIESALQKNTYREVVQDALRQAFQRLTQDQRNLLRLHYLDGLRLEEIGSLLGVHKATISRRLADARAQILKMVREDLCRRLASPESVINSILTLMQSQLDESLSALLGSGMGTEAPLAE